MQPQTDTREEAGQPHFALGRTCIAPGAPEALEMAGQTPFEFLRRHLSGDRGELSENDLQENEF